MGQELRLNLLFTISAVAANVLPNWHIWVLKGVDDRLMRLLLGQSWIGMDRGQRQLLGPFSLLLGHYCLVLDRKVFPLRIVLTDSF